nr:nuclear pore complex protein Nup160 homolog [Leptinotarsa decemlineata]
MGDSLEGTESSSETQNVALVDFTAFTNFILKAATVLLPEDDGQAEPTNLVTALDDKVNQEYIRKFISDPQVTTLYIQRNSSKDDDSDQPPEGEEEKEPVMYYVSNEVHYSNSKMSSLVCIKRGPVVEADKSIRAQVRLMNFSEGSPYEILHDYVSRTVAPFFKSYVKESGRADRKGGNFLLAASFLTTGENYKAQELFERAAKGIFTDTFLQERVLKGAEDNPTKAYINYYLKVIQLFELHKARDCAISIANTALSVVEPTDPLTATLYSIKFKHQLALKHYELAFDSLYSNPDAERKKDNLRDLVKTLLDEKKLDKLLNFTYGNLDEFFTNILLSRARASDGINNIFYDFLYSYQIKRGALSHRLAASVMYEQAFRLNHINTAESLEKQVKCYLAAKNVLQLCKPEHAWVVRPSDPDEEEEEIVIQPLAGSKQELKVVKLQKQVEVVNIEVIKTELIFASAKLKLARFNSAAPVTITSAVELVTLLNNAGLFKTSLEICKTFNLPYSSVFETLTKHCVNLTEQDQPTAWNWLVENDLQDLPVNRDSASDVVWQLLQDYLEKYEQPYMTTLHYVVCKKIINMRMYIPHWLLASYKLRNAPELLRLLHGSGRLEEAIEVANEYLLAALGYGKEFYGFSKPVAPVATTFCLPVYAIQSLINELDLHNSKRLEQPYIKECVNLKSVFSKYLETSTRVSNQMCQTALTSGTLRTNMPLMS